VEQASAEALFASPLHPYTHGLFRSVPRLGEKKHRLDTIEGSVPNPLHFPSGCKFHPRCDMTRRAAKDAAAGQATTIAGSDGPVKVLLRCATREPDLREVNPGHWAACWLCEGYDNAKANDPCGDRKEQ
jgi:oligopeptide/dipeptide ABC transporter ATP-binding protein